MNSERQILIDNQLSNAQFIKCEKLIHINTNCLDNNNNDITNYKFLNCDKLSSISFNTTTYYNDDNTPFSC